MKRFFLNLKMESIWQRDYANYREAKADISHYIVNFYSPLVAKNLAVQGEDVSGSIPNFS